MSGFVKFIWLAFLTVILTLIDADTAHAYIDPSTGSYLLQILLAGLLGAAFAVKIFWRRVRAFLVRVFTGKGDTGNTPE